ncbi:Uncharacterized protein APZ42_015130 [Daphnia magna]|uniref:Uncharacterized protein n=1 Tax=Daphnia magna TaxID=35525 RepID=A0A162P7M8_9CRUS|nr:Uncharacterized protein APZ42_015130 [Daphnia magna]
MEYINTHTHTQVLFLFSGSHNNNKPIISRGYTQQFGGAGIINAFIHKTSPLFFI